MPRKWQFFVTDFAPQILHFGWHLSAFKCSNCSADRLCLVAVAPVAEQPCHSREGALSSVLELPALASVIKNASRASTLWVELTFEGVQPLLWMRSLQTGGEGKTTREGAVGVVREVSLAAFALADGTRSGAALYSTYLQRKSLLPQRRHAHEAEPAFSGAGRAKTQQP